MTSPTHDATALTAAFVLWPPHGDMTGLLLAVGLIATMGAMEAVATARFRPRERAWRAECNRLRMQGVEHPEEALQRPRWQGPRRSLTRPMRLLALIGTAMASMPLAVALGCARLPDQLEVGPIDHRKLTHRLITAAVLIYGVHCGALWLAHASPDVTLAQGEQLWQAFTLGYSAHLVADLCTIAGLAILWPLVRRELHLLPRGFRIRTGSLVDTFVMALSLGVIVWAVQ